MSVHSPNEIDPFLELHRINPLEFTISGPVAPISIRDQMVRAKIFVDRAQAAGILSTERGLLVVGAGAAGISAAIYAAQCEIPTTLVEKRSYAFDLQRDCTERWIDPAQYDWPATFWHCGSFPLPNDPPVPLPWKAGYAGNVAIAWEKELETAQNSYSQLSVEYLTRWHDSKYQPPANPDDYGTVDVTFAVPEQHPAPDDPADIVWQLTPPRSFDAILYAVGFGGERTGVGDYRGFEFWQDDGFQDIALLGDGITRRILISGAGDGALQDFLRIACGLDSAAEIFHRLVDATGTALIGEEILREIYTIEDQARRAIAWNQKYYDHDVYARLDQEHGLLVQNLLNSSRLWMNSIGNLLEHSRSLHLDLVHSCHHFTASYPLNRFLTHLLAQAAPRLGFQIEIHPNRSLAKVTGNSSSHKCDGTPIGCEGQSHVAEIAVWDDCNERPHGATATFQDPYPYDLIVVRHGIDIPEPFRSIKKPMFYRHLPPYYPAS
jgi:hypothetical protein